MIIRQESITDKMSFKDLPALSPLPNASLVTVFGSVKRFSDSKLVGVLKARYPTAQIVGCTTSGEINSNGVFDDSIQITAVQWEKTVQRASHVKISAGISSFDAAAGLAKQLNADSLRTILVFADGLLVNGSELLLGFQSVLGDLPIIGGMAGDGASFTKTLQIFNDVVSDGLIIAIGLYGSSLITTSGALGGWRPYGPPRKVTRAVKNVVYELDGKPALPLYRLYIGEHYAKALPSSGLNFPFAVIEAENKDVAKVRTLAGFSEKDNSVSFFGNVEEGVTVRLCQTNHERLVEGASGAAHLVSDNLKGALNQTGLAICVSCVGRKLVMDKQTTDEVTAVKAILGAQTFITGFYSYGEIAPRPKTTDSVLHNQTMTIGYLSEDLLA